MQLLGQILVDKQLINAAQRDKALAAAKESGSRLGDTLVASGMIGYLPLYQAVAEYHKLPFINLLDMPLDTSLLSDKLVKAYLHLRILPYAKENGIIYLATSELNDEVRQWAYSQYGEDIEFAITSPVDIRRSVQRYFGPGLSHQSRFALYEAAPDMSARTPTHRSVHTSTLLILGLLAYGLWAAPFLSILLTVVVCYIIYSFTLLFKIVVYLTGLGANKEDVISDVVIPDADLPIYTILVPMYRETESLPAMLKALQNMDYPASKMDVKLILEEDDNETINAAKALKPHYQFELVVVPPSEPRTKPKACNFALHFARGEYITIYDADDIPARDQLKKAVKLFRDSPKDVICLQSRLNYYNTHDNWITRCFSLEYSMLFHVILYGIVKLRMPLLLGGTSNHISLAKLKELGEWDPFNVTEDADLGARLAARGYRTIMMDSDTLEEAPNTLNAWLNQRARWIKGYMQTWLVHMRHPTRMLKNYKIHGFIGFQCFVALASFAYLTAPIVWLLALLWLLSDITLFPNWLYVVASINLLMNFLVHIATAAHAACLYQSRHGTLLFTAATYPFYLILHTVASYMALYQLFKNPYGWNKTVHGRAKTYENITVRPKLLVAKPAAWH